MNNTYDLWKLLSSYDIVVPVIQRDYAQGRKDKEYIRKTFLTEIKSYLCNNKVVTLDFVYGNIDGTRFYPLDGQQRLTTLWLVYWYISFKAGELTSDCKILRKFTYETRSSSGEFCRELCEKMQHVTCNDIDGYNGIVEFVKAQTWFYSSWLQDPTVSAMLRTLGGDGNTVDDNIEAIFAGSDYDSLRSRLIKNPIIDFELMIIGGEKLPISDDLYIKMNARGKGLTDFENFKADLVAWIQSSENPDHAEFEKTTSIDDRLISYKHYYPSQIDNKWTDVFWNSARKRLESEFDGRIDAIYFSFINRFVLNSICVNSNMQPAEFAQGKEDDAHKDEKSVFDRLFGTGLRGSSANDSLVKYEGFAAYKKYITSQLLSDIDYIFETISDSAVIDAIEAALAIKDADEDEEEKSDSSSGYAFIPQYSFEHDHVLISTSQKERVYFLAICNFILNCREINGFDNVKFYTCMRLIKKLSDKMTSNNNDIYVCLRDYSDPFSSSQLECQLREEKEKAEKILSDNGWEDKIKEAENFEFFNGTIRFLYRNIKVIEWDDYDKKFETAKKLFRTSISASTIEKFLNQHESFEGIKDKYLFTSVGYHPRHKCWKKDILCSDADDVLSKVNAMLMDYPEPQHDADFNEFLASGLIKIIVAKPENYRYRYHWYSYWSIHKDYSQTEGVYISLERKEKNRALKTLVDARKITIIDTAFNQYQNGYYWGVRVDFEYNDNKYRWYEVFENGNRADKIYLVANDKESANALDWNNPDNLISEINSFDSWN